MRSSYSPAKLTVEEQKFDDLRWNLKQSQKELLENGDFQQASNTESKIKALEIQHQEGQVSKLEEKHLEEKNWVQECYQEVLESLKQVWRQKFRDFQQRQERLMEQFREKQEDLVTREQKRVYENNPNRFKQSSAVLNLVKQKEQAVRLSKIQEAKILTDTIVKLTQKEKTKYEKQRKQKIKGLLRNCYQKLDKELLIFQERQKQAYSEICMERKEELRKVKKKFDNIRREMMSSQSIQKNKALGRHVTGVGMRIIQKRPKSRSISSNGITPVKTRSYSVRIN